MAGSFAQGCIQPLAEGLQQVEGHKGLDGAGKAAAVDPIGSPALEIVLAQCQAGMTFCRYI